MSCDKMVMVGDRVELLSIDDSYTSLDKGDVGTVISFGKTLTGERQIWVEWDRGNTLALLEGVDEYKVID